MNLFQCATCCLIRTEPTTSFLSKNVKLFVVVSTLYCQGINADGESDEEDEEEEEDDEEEELGNTMLTKGEITGTGPVGAEGTAT